MEGMIYTEPNGFSLIFMLIAITLSFISINYHYNFIAKVFWTLLIRALYPLKRCSSFAGASPLLVVDELPDPHFILFIFQKFLYWRWECFIFFKFG